MFYPFRFINLLWLNKERVYVQEVPMWILTFQKSIKGTNRKIWISWSVFRGQNWRNLEHEALQSGLSTLWFWVAELVTKGGSWGSWLQEGSYCQIEKRTRKCQYGYNRGTSALINLKLYLIGLCRGSAVDFVFLHQLLAPNSPIR